MMADCKGIENYYNVDWTEWRSNQEYLKVNLTENQLLNHSLQLLK